MPVSVLAIYNGHYLSHLMEANFFKKGAPEKNCTLHLPGRELMYRKLYFRIHTNNQLYDMPLNEILEHYSALTLLWLILLSFTAGFLDAVVGGGGLIQLPALLINLPGTPLPTIFGTNKIASLAGTSVAAWQYSRRIRFNWTLLGVLSVCAFASSFTGAKTVSYVNPATLKPAILVILILMAVYTYIRKDLGSVQRKHLSLRQQALYGGVLAAVIGFYDGFFGPGTGSFFVLGFVVILGFEFVTASAYSKMVNCITNLSALVVFVSQGNYILEIALLLSVCNIAGNLTGSRMALRKGNEFVRIIFLVVVSLMILRYGYDLFTEW